MGSPLILPAGRAGPRLLGAAIALPLLLVLLPVLFLGDPGTAPPPAPAGPVVGIPATYLAWYLRGGEVCDAVPWNVLAAVGKVESDHGANAGRSGAGAVGPMQFLPSTWQAWGADADRDGRADPRSPADAIVSAARYLCDLARRFGSLPLALAAYVAGPGAVAEAGGVPPSAASYVEAVLSWAERYAEEAAATGTNGLTGGGPFALCPVQGPVRFADDFGAPRYAGGFHLHAGIDILAPLGAPVVAPFPGTAVETSNTLGGLAVTVYGGEGRVYNAHLSRIGAVGPVRTGTVIGYVGNTGDAAGGPTHNHFEWHPRAIPADPHVSPYGQSLIGTAVDPYPYLVKVCR